MQTEPEQAARELLHAVISEWRAHGTIHAAALIQAAFAEREARLVEAVEGLSAEVMLLDLAVSADDPKREIRLRISDIAYTLAALKDRTDG